MTQIKTADDVMRAFRAAISDQDDDKCRAIFSGSVDDHALRALAAGTLVLRGDSDIGFEILHKDRV